MADYPLVRFVSAPSLGATTRFDLNPSSDIYTWHDGFTLGAPKFLGAPDAIAPELGLRQAKLTFQIKAPRAELDAMMTDLARELMRGRNWLLVQRSADSRPRWLYTYASAPDDLSWAAVRNASNEIVPDTWTINLTIDADADLWGAQESFTATISANPAVGGGIATLPAIKGDLPAPLVARVDLSTSADATLAFSITQADDSAGVTDAAVVWQAETVYPSVAVADGTYSGASYANLTSTSLTASTITGVTMPPLGRCRLWALVDGRSSTFTMYARYEQRLNGEVATVAAGRQWVSFGDFATPPTGGARSGDGTAPVPSLALNWTRLTGADTPRVDAFVWMPIDVENMTVLTTFLDFNGPSVSTAVMDGERLAAFLLSGTTLSRTTPIVAGPYLSVIPGGTNTLRALGLVTALTDTITLTATYHPRYLNLPGA